MRRVLIDGSMAKGGGGCTYLVNILPRLVEFAPGDRFRVLLRSEKLAQSIASLPGLEVDLLPDGGWQERLAFTCLRAPRIAEQWGADLYFSVGEYAPPRAHCPVIASFRNPNVFTSLDQGWSWPQRMRLHVLRALGRISALTCDRIMFVSEDSARWIGDSIGLPEERRAVVHHGIDFANWGQPRGAVPGLDKRDFILSVSSVYRYKNYVRLIEAYAALARRRDDLPELVIIGDDQDPDYSRQMREARAATGDLAERIHILGEVPYTDIKAYYAAAALFVFPSYLETFGHPILEAMASDVPVVASDIAVFREIAGNAAFYADPYKTDAFASAIEEALFEPRARETLIKHARKRVRDFGWDRTARRLLALFDEVIAGRVASPAKLPGSVSIAGGSAPSPS
jgi:glycosyltransferase involved in cell wall biosynthesis